MNFIYKNTSNGSRLVKSAARSPVRSIAGPEVTLKLTQSHLLLSQLNMFYLNQVVQKVRHDQEVPSFFAESINILRFSISFA